jgi:hypothetical protein
LLLLVTKHIGEQEVESELAELHLDLQFPDAGKAQMQANRRRDPSINLALFSRGPEARPFPKFSRISAAAAIPRRLSLLVNLSISANSPGVSDLFADAWPRPESHSSS